MTIQLQKSKFSSASAVFAAPTTSTLIVVPCYNEAERLSAEAFVDYVDQTDGVSFLFVDDGSKDAKEGGREDGNNDAGEDGSKDGSDDAGDHAAKDATIKKEAEN